MQLEVGSPQPPTNPWKQDVCCPKLESGDDLLQGSIAALVDSHSHQHQGVFVTGTLSSVTQLVPVDVACQLMAGH
jgi:hypothetical protein